MKLRLAAALLIAPLLFGCTLDTQTTEVPGSGGSGGTSMATGGMGAAAGTASSCTITNDPGTSGHPPDMTTIKLVITGTQPPCVASDCHGVGGANPLQMPQDNDAQLVHNFTTVMSTACGMPVVVPCHPELSALSKLLKGPCGDLPRMPKGCTAEDGNCVPDDFIAAVDQWITNGAPAQ